MGLSYTESKRVANKTIVILAIITIFEVLFALLGKGHLISGVYFPLWLVSGVMILLSIVKAYLIIYEFMHLKYEVPALAKSILFPLVLLVWAAIAFSWEGDSWKNNREDVQAADDLGRKPVSEEIKVVDSKHIHDVHHGKDKKGH